MLPIPAALQASFEAYLRAGKIPETAHAYYKKWLRFYLDFCRKYHAAPSRRESLPLFQQKLHEKKQPEWQQQQATHAVSLYYELLQARVIITFPLLAFPSAESAAAHTPHWASHPCGSSTGISPLSSEL
jgi:hypothetical protein